MAYLCYISIAFNTYWLCIVVLLFVNLYVNNKHSNICGYVDIFFCSRRNYVTIGKVIMLLILVIVVSLTLPGENMEALTFQR